MALPIRHALILTAGLGTRLRPLTDVRAKPAIPVAGVPLVRRIASWLASQGVTDLVLNLHHRPETLTAVVGDGRDLGARVRYSWEQPRVLGSAGGPRLALPIIGAERFFIVNGDTLTDLDLGRSSTRTRVRRAGHARAGAEPRVPAVRRRAARRRGDVTGFVRRGPAAAGSYHFVGVQVAEAAVFATLPAGEPRELDRRRLRRADRARDPAPCAAFVCDAAFWDVGTIGRLLAHVARLRGANAAERQPRPYGAAVHATARVTRSILWDDVAVGADAAARRCIVTDGVAIRAGDGLHRRGCSCAATTARHAQRH